jgi:hypothetical protein
VQEPIDFFRERFGCDSWFKFVSVHFDNIAANRHKAPFHLLYQMFLFVAETENGGVLQYLTNSSGDEFEKLGLSADEVDLPFFEDWMNRIRAVFPDKDISPDREQRVTSLIAITGDPISFDPFDSVTADIDEKRSAVERVMNEYCIQHSGELPRG